MAEGLFDGRYRYDYIYPRGRSGETLRAYDTANNERPVVVKRPAPNDAPPIRAGQEVSILNERDALMKLAGHPVATELTGEGHFMVGGTSHRYIAMERGTGEIVEEMVLALNERGERLPLLETLVIADSLLDLISTAHERDIIYNDVDAKHLFWNRDTYGLKVIDWGNAVLLEGEEASPQGVTKQADVYQTGELLYFILTGGGRADVPRDADETFMVSMGDDAERLPTELIRIVSAALHPNPRLRYASVGDLRRELTRVRRPLESDRNGVLSRVNERLRRSLSKDELHDLTRILQPALAMDPGFPATLETEQEILNRLNDLQIASDLDAVKIYLESGNWRGAADILSDLRSNARGEMQRTARLLFDWAMLLLEDENTQATPAVMEAIRLVFDAQWANAARLLVTSEMITPADERVHMRLAERVTSHVPDVVLLHPNLYRMKEALLALDGTEGVSLTEQRELMDEIDRMLAEMDTDDTVSLIALRDAYRGVVDRLSAMTTLMEAVNMGWGERRLPLSSLERARLAAMALADNMHVVGKQAARTPREALAALDNSRDIDPANPVWDAVTTLLNNLYRLLESYQTYVPVADASDLALWLRRSQDQLKPYADRLFDDMLANMLQGLKAADDQWATLDNHAVAGNRVGAVRALENASQAVGTVSPTLSGWFNQLRSVLNNADYIERHALTGGLGRALADGWAAFDRGNLADAERLALHADQIAKTDMHSFVVNRFKALVETMRGWIERNGVLSLERTEAALDAVTGLYTDEENIVRERFNKQMPTRETYLKAMGKGLVETYALHSSAALRILFADYVIQGAIDAHEGVFEDATFWETAAVRTLEPHGTSHIAVQTLRSFIQRRQDLLQIQDEFAQINSMDAIPRLEEYRLYFEKHAQAKLIAEAARSLREVENALPDWANGEFRTAGLKLENALKAAQENEKTASIDLSAYKEWVGALQSVAADLHTVRRNLTETIEAKPDAPTPALADAHRMMLERTTATVGAAYTSTLELWQNTYTSFAAVVTDDTRRRSAKLTAMNELFRAMFIDRHPAYALYRHWFDHIERAPEFPAPPTDEPEPRMTEEDAEVLPDAPPEAATVEAFGVEGADAPVRPRRGGGGMSRVVIGLVVLAALAAAGVVASTMLNGGQSTPTPPAVAAEDTSVPPAAADLATEDVTAAALVTDNVTAEADSAVTEETSALVLATEDPTETRTATTIPTDTDTPTPAATDTPTATFTPSNTPTETNTPTATVTFTPTVPAEGLTGEVNVLTLISRLPRENSDAIFWDETRLEAAEDFWRLGIGAETAEETYALMPPEGVFEQYFGAGSPARVTVTEAEVALATFNPTLLEGDGVAFGLMLVPVGSAAPVTDGAGIYVQVVQAGVLNIGTTEGGNTDIDLQRAVNNVIVRMRLERTPDGAVTVSFNGEELGEPVQPRGSIDPSVPVVPALFVTDGGVILNVTDWTVTLR